MRILITGGSGFIGTNFIDEISREANTILNYSLHPPLKAEHKQYWRAGDILDPVATTAAFQEFQPREVLHLAARAECDEKTTVENGYRANTEGTRNILWRRFAQRLPFSARLSPHRNLSVLPDGCPRTTRIIFRRPFTEKAKSSPRS